MLFVLATDNHLCDGKDAPHGIVIGEANIVTVCDIRILHNIITFASAYEHHEVRAAVRVDADDHRVASGECGVDGGGLASSGNAVHVDARQ